MNIKIKKLVQVSLLIALFVVLGKVATIDYGRFKISIKSLPVYIGGIVAGPIEGALIGGIGELVLQLTGQYGFTPTTPIWVMPYTIIGLLAGIVFKNKLFNNSLNQSVLFLNRENTKESRFRINIILFSTMIVFQVLLTALNTAAIYIDSVVFSYYRWELVFGMLIYRLFFSIIVGVIFSIIIPDIVFAIKKIHWPYC